MARKATSEETAIVAALMERIGHAEYCASRSGSPFCNCGHDAAYYWLKRRPVEENAHDTEKPHSSDAL
jgi:hypothetical protein